MIQRKISLLANGAASALQDDQFEILPYNSLVEIALLADAAGVLATVYSGQDLLMDEGPVPIGTVIKFPDDYHLQDVAAVAERLKIRLRDTSGAARTVLVGVRISQIV